MSAKVPISMASLGSSWCDTEICAAKKLLIINVLHASFVLLPIWYVKVTTDSACKQRLVSSL